MFLLMKKVLFVALFFEKKIVNIIIMSLIVLSYPNKFNYIIKTTRIRLIYYNKLDSFFYIRKIKTIKMFPLLMTNENIFSGILIF